MVVHVATDGAIVVVKKIEESSDGEVAAAPLNPYQPSQRIKTPNAPSGIECPGMALILVTFPFLSLEYLPILAPRTAAPIKAAMPPTI